MRIFLDVGANTGQTLKAVLDYEPRFDRIVCFEPASACWGDLKKLADDRVTIARFGLWDRDAEHEIIGPGTKGASIWRKNNVTTQAREICRFKKASTWFARNIKIGDIVFLKLNCEGAECDIIDDLLDSCEFARINYAMIDFDVRKIAGQKHREAETRERLQRAGLCFPRIAFTKEAMIGPTHQERIRHWLGMVEGR